MLQNKSLFLCLLWSFSVLMACKKEKQLEGPTVEALVAEKIAAFKQERLVECHKEAIVEANRLVDSTLLANAKEKKAFGTIKPPIPEKPIKPDPLKPIDSAAVKPILPLTQEAQDSINQIEIELKEFEDTLEINKIMDPDSLPQNEGKGQDF